MRIRKYLMIAVAVLIALAFGAVAAYQYFFSHLPGQGKTAMETQGEVSRLARVEGEKLQVYKGERWEDFEVRGIQLSSFHPGYEKNKGGVREADVKEWLSMIADTGANTIFVPYLQPPAFYNALFDFNLEQETPLYILHSVPIDAKTAMVYYNAYEPEIVDNMWTDLRNTVDALHGRAVILDESRHHGGIFLKDVSAYMLGYVIGDNTSAEVVTLTNQRYPRVTSFKGSHYSVEDSNAFTCFIAENLEYIHEYELSHYGSLSLYSYISTPETDPLPHRLETNTTKNAVVNMDAVKILSDTHKNLLVSYSAHPNNPDFLDYDETDMPVVTAPGQVSSYQKYLAKLVAYHDRPVLITSTGIPASRGTSRIDLDDGYRRGGHTEAAQGELLVEILQDVSAAGCVGAVVQSFQDDWGLYSTFNTREYTDADATVYWQDVQASDECFGLLEFVTGSDSPPCIVDGDVSEWTKDPLYEDENMQVSATSDTKYLYLMVQAKDWQLKKDELFLALDVTPESGSKRWEEKALDLPFAADFIICMGGDEGSRVVVQDRYNLFRYHYTYYSYVVEKQVEMPAADAQRFRSIYQMNRFNVLLKDSRTLAPVEYTETGALVSGTTDPKDPEYNSKSDYYVAGEVAEIRIPWSLINVKDPVKRVVHQDFYTQGIEGDLKISSLGLGLVHRQGETTRTSEAFSYRLGNLRNQKYHSRLRQSAEILKTYWHKTNKS